MVGVEQKVDLLTIFKLQEAAADQNLKRLPLLQQVMSFLSQGIAIEYRILNEMAFEATKQTVIRLLAGDCISHIVVATRLGLWGAIPEALSILRGALESGAQLEYIVKENIYQTAIYEIQSKRFDRIAYDRIKVELGELGKSADRLHGRLSDLASHSTGRRLSLVEYNLDGEDYDRLGFSVDPNWVLHAEYLSMLCLMQLTTSLYSVHTQEGKGVTIDDQILAWKICFDQLCTRVSEMDQRSAKSES